MKHELIIFLHKLHSLTCNFFHPDMITQFNTLCRFYNKISQNWNQSPKPLTELFQKVYTNVANKIYLIFLYFLFLLLFLPGFSFFSSVFSGSQNLFFVRIKFKKKGRGSKKSDIFVASGKKKNKKRKCVCRILWMQSFF